MKNFIFILITSLCIVLSVLLTWLIGLHFGYQMIVGVVVISIFLWYEDKIKNSNFFKRFK